MHSQVYSRMIRRVLLVLLGMLAGITARRVNGHEGHQPLPSKGVLVDVERGHVALTDQARDAIGVKTQEVVVGKVANTLTVNMETVAPWQAKAFGSAQISGRITKLLVRPGEIVTKDQVVAELTSREIETIRFDYLRAKREMQLNAQLIAMTKPSTQAGAVPLQRLLDLENAYQQSVNALEIAAIRAQSLGIDASRLEKSEGEPIFHLIRSPIAGKIVHSDLSEGKFVEAFEHLFEIVNGEEIWVRLQLLEKDLLRVHVGQEVSLEFLDTALSINSKIERIDSSLEPQTQVSWAWLSISHPSVVPGLVGRATIYTSTQASSLAIPHSAIFSDGLQPYVFVEEAATRESSEFRKRSIQLGNRRLMGSASDGPSLEVLQGDVYPGDRVVVQGGHELSSLFFLGVLKLPEQDRKRIGISTSVATKQPMAKTVGLDAIATLPPEGRSVVSSQLAGTIHSHNLCPGCEVKAGDLLLEIASPDFYALQLALLETALDAELARDRALRLEEVKSEAVSRRLVMETRALADRLEGQVESLQRQLESLGLSAGEIEEVVNQKKPLDYLPIRARIDGRISYWKGTLGETVLANQALVEIRDLRSMWGEAHVPTTLMGGIEKSSGGMAYILSNPNIQFPVAIVRISPVVSESTRTQRVWFSLPIQDSQQPLRDGMKLTALIRIDIGTPGLAVPASAIIRDGLHHFVFVQREDDYLERRRVRLGRTDGEVTEIVEGIVEGEVIVSEGGRELQTAFASLR